MKLFKNKVGRPTNREVKTKLILKIILFILIVILAFLIGYFLKNLGASNKNDIITEENIDSLTDIDWRTPKGTKGEVGIYQAVESKALFIDTKDEYNEWIHDEKNYKKKYTYKCNKEDCKGQNIYEYLNYAVIKDGNYVLYDYVNNKYKKIEIDEKNIDEVILLYNAKKIYGYALKNTDGKVAIYNIEKNKTITDFKYTSYFYNDNPELIDGNLLVIDDNNQYVLDFNSGKEKLTFNKWDDENLENTFMIQAIGNNDYVYYVKNYGMEINNSEICDKNFNNIIDGKYEQYGVLSNGNFIVKMTDTTFGEYNKNGKLINKSKEYKKVISIGYDYIGIIDNDNYLKIIDKNEKVLAKFIEITDKHYIHEFISGWYKAEGKEGLYLVVEDENIPIGTLGRGVEYFYDIKSKKTGKIELTEIGGYAKPVLYLYPTKDNTKISVSFAKPELLTTTYPKYKNSWEVTANKNGDLKDKDNKYYYGLYWEENGSINVKFNEGFYVTKDNAIEFLEEKLTTIGLNDREKNEFIMYWLPILEKNEKNLVYFELTKSREAYNKLNINPKPDSLLRVAIHIKKVDKKINIKAQKLTTFERKGFTAVEWGGFNY